MRVIVIIPARLASSRLQGKVLAEICSKPMVQHVYEASLKAKHIESVYIATDSIKVKNVCEQFTKNIIMTSIVHESGTDRLAEAVEYIECDAIINVQGDEPLIDSELIDTLALKLANESVQMTSAMHKITKIEELKSPNAVKVTVDKNMNALYFSRSIIPYHRDNWDALLNHHEKIPEPLKFYKHIGIYGYTKSFLKQYAHMEQTYLEKLEKLEQLRVLENGYNISMIETEYIPICVDTQEDLEQVREIMQCQ